MRKPRGTKTVWWTWVQFAVLCISIPTNVILWLDRRSQELNHFARYLRRCRQEMQKQLHRERTTIAGERAELLRFHEQIRSAGDSTSVAGSVSGLLVHLPWIKQEIAGTSPSAPGAQLRVASDLITADPEPSSAD